MHNDTKGSEESNNIWEIVKCIYHLSFNFVQNFILTANAFAMSISGLGEMHLNGDLYLGSTLTNLSMRGLARIWYPEVPPKKSSSDIPTLVTGLDKREKVSP
jgi:hypothetical protein